MKLSCPYCHSSNPPSDSRCARMILRHGCFYRGSDRSLQKRFLCKRCLKTFSVATLDPRCWQKKREYNTRIFIDLTSGVSQRRLARNLGLNRKTIVRKFIFLGQIAQEFLREQLRMHPKPIESFQFDDLETFEHSKLKPLSVTMAVESGTRKILGFRVGSMPAKGHLVQRSLKKYGVRKDERGELRRELFAEIQPFIKPGAVIKSDENPHYTKDVKSFFPTSPHRVYKSRRGCVVGQGELKSGGYDPIFSLNHTFAMLRANINRLFRKTWNTTKKKENLSFHIAIYSIYHNQIVLR